MILRRRNSFNTLRVEDSAEEFDAENAFQLCAAGLTFSKTFIGFAVSTCLQMAKLNLVNVVDEELYGKVICGHREPDYRRFSYLCKRSFLLLRIARLIRQDYRSHYSGS